MFDDNYDDVHLEIDGEDISLSEELYKELKKFSSDPEYLRAFQEASLTAHTFVRAVEEFAESPAQELSETLRQMGILLAIPFEQKVWNGIDISHISPTKRLYVLVMLNATPSGLRQEILNFLTCRDLDKPMEIKLKRFTPYDPNPLVGYPEKGYEFLLRELKIPEQQKSFALGFIDEMLEEAEPYRHRCILGEFEMIPPPMGYLTKTISFDRIRLSISPRGIYTSLISEQEDEVWCTPFWWSPEFNTLSLLGKEGWMLKVMMAGIWRDACVVREKFVTERSRSVYQARRRQSVQQKKVTVLPRVIRKVAWADDVERGHITRTAHTVRAFYRRLQKGQKASQEAKRNAKHYGFPRPPKGHTFVQPHQRGGGEVTEQPQRVVCRGLRTVTIALNILNQEEEV